MATNLSIDPDLLDLALAVSGERTKKAAVTKALQEFIARRQQKRLLELIGALEWDEGVRLQGRALAPVSLFVDTSVWSLGFPARRPGFARSSDANWSAPSKPARNLSPLGSFCRSFCKASPDRRIRAQILDRFAALPLLVPDRRDHVDAAELRNKCRRGGVQIGTIDALLAQLCLRHDLAMLTADGDFRHIAGHCALNL